MTPGGPGVLKQGGKSMQRSRIILFIVVALLVVLALPAVARADEIVDSTPAESVVPATEPEPIPDGWTWDEAKAPRAPAPDGWTWDEATAPG
jgi:hypothetical protein